MRFRSNAFRGAALAAALVLVAALAIVATAAPNVNWRPGPPSPFAFTRFDGETVSQADIPDFGAARTFFLGGRQQDNSTNGRIWSFSGNAFNETRETMTIPISNYQIAKLTDRAGNVRLYVFGGRDDLGDTIGTVQWFDPKTKRTGALDAADDYPGVTPSDCTALPAMGVAVVENHAVVMGGIAVTSGPEPCPQSELTNQVWIFDPTARTGRKWKRGPNLTMARGYVTPAVVGNKIFAIGGDIWDDTGTLLVAVNRVDSVTNILDPASKFRRKADLPQPCDESQAFGFKRGELANHIILAGCGQWPNAIPDSFDYDVAGDSWASSDALNEARRNHAGFMSPKSGKVMYILGGYAVDGTTVISSSESSKAEPFAGAGRGASGAVRGTGAATTY